MLKYGSSPMFLLFFPGSLLQDLVAAPAVRSRRLLRDGVDGLLAPSEPRIGSQHHLQRHPAVPVSSRQSHLPVQAGAINSHWLRLAELHGYRQPAAKRLVQYSGMLVRPATVSDGNAAHHG